MNKHRIAFFVLAAPLFFLPTVFLTTGHLLGSLLFLAFGVALGVAGSCYRGSLPIAGGALAALFAGTLGGGALGVSHAALAAAVCFGMIYAERTLRIRSNTGKGVHLALALGGGALAGTIAESYGGAAPAVPVTCSAWRMPSPVMPGLQAIW